MKAYPLIFGDFSIRSILRGTKIQTRRTVPCELAYHDEKLSWRPNATHCERCRAAGKGEWSYIFDAPRPPWLWTPGTRVWVKESWWPRTGDKRRSEVLYKATDFNSMAGGAVAWKSPMFMPRWASRLTLEVEDVRVERLQSITREDAWAEGIAQHCEGCALGPDYASCAGCYDAVAKYVDLWNELNGKKAPWIENPFVRRIRFHRVDEPATRQAEARA